MHDKISVVRTHVIVVSIIDGISARITTVIKTYITVCAENVFSQLAQLCLMVPVASVCVDCPVCNTKHCSSITGDVYVDQFFQMGGSVY